MKRGLHTHEGAEPAHGHAHGVAIMAITIALLLGVCGTLGGAASAAPSGDEATTRADTVPAATLALGRRVYEGRAGGALCATCHGPNARGVAGLGPDLTDRTWLHGDGSRESLESVIRAGVMRPKQGGAMMPPRGGGSLTPEQVAAVAAYVHSLSH